MNEKIFACDNCYYLFTAEDGCDRCPDCGKERIRPANEAEIAEYQERKHHTSD